MRPYDQTPLITHVSRLNRVTTSALYNVNQACRGLGARYLTSNHLRATHNCHMHRVHMYCYRHTTLYTITLTYIAKCRFRVFTPTDQPVYSYNIHTYAQYQ